jgi:hypothetical protein
MVQTLQTQLLVLKILHVLTCFYISDTGALLQESKVMHFTFCGKYWIRVYCFVDYSFYNNIFSYALLNLTAICKSEHSNFLQIATISNQYTYFFWYSFQIKVELHGHTGYDMTGKFNSAVLSSEHVKLEPIHTPFMCHRGKYVLKA